MPDNPNGPEIVKPLDLRNAPYESDSVKRINLPSLPEKLAAHNESHHFEAGAIVGEKPREALVPGGIVAVSEQRQKQEARYKEIETALADGLEEIFLSMEPIAKQRFKQAGEEASRSINDLIEKGKSTARKIIDIIRKWLAMAPGINKFFLEQEAKIKTDKILEIQRKYV